MQDLAFHTALIYFKTHRPSQTPKTEYRLFSEIEIFSQGTEQSLDSATARAVTIAALVPESLAY